MTVSLFVAFLSWASFFIALWLGWGVDTVSAYQWGVIIVSFFIGIVSGLLQTGRA